MDGGLVAGQGPPRAQRLVATPEGSYTSCPCSPSHPAWAMWCLTHVSGLHGTVEQYQVLHKKDFFRSLHQLREQYSGQADEPGEAGRKIPSQGQGLCSVDGFLPGPEESTRGW